MLHEKGSYATRDLEHETKLIGCGQSLHMRWCDQHDFCICSRSTASTALRCDTFLNKLPHRKVQLIQMMLKWSK